jgi:hypothetical protein
MKYLTFPKPLRFFYTASHSFSGRVLKANCSGPISGIIRTVVRARMSDLSTTKILSRSRRMTIAYHSWCFLFLTHLTFRLRLSPTGDEITAEKRENDDLPQIGMKPMLLLCSAAAWLPRIIIEPTALRWRIGGEVSRYWITSGSGDRPALSK